MTKIGKIVGLSYKKSAGNWLTMDGTGGFVSQLRHREFTQKMFSGLQKGPAARGHVKKRQKSSKSVKKFFDNFRAGQKTSKIVKKCQKYFRHFSTIFARHHFSGPFWGALKMCANCFLWIDLGRVDEALNNLTAFFWSLNAGHVLACGESWGTVVDCHKNIAYPKKKNSNYFPITVSRFPFVRINFRKLPDTYCICVSCVTLPGWDPCPCHFFFRYPIWIFPN